MGIAAEPADVAGQLAILHSSAERSRNNQTRLWLSHAVINALLPLRIAASSTCHHTKCKRIEKS